MSCQAVYVAWSSPVAEAAGPVQLQIVPRTIAAPFGADDPLAELDVLVFGKDVAPVADGFPELLHAVSTVLTTIRLATITSHDFRHIFHAFRLRPMLAGPLSLEASQPVRLDGALWRQLSSLCPSFDKPWRTQVTYRLLGM